MSEIQGKAFVYGDDINTDVIFPGKYTYTVTEPDEIAQHAMEDEDPAFVKEVNPGDIIVGGKNFGCGSSREQAAFCFKYLGIGAIIAESYSRIYFRNCINAGLPAIAVPGITDHVSRGDLLTVDTGKGVLTRPSGDTFTFPPLPPEVNAIMNAGGLSSYIRRKLSS